MQRALSSAVEGITISDPSLPDNPLIYVNKGFEELTGYTAREVLGKNCRCLQGRRCGAAACPGGSVGWWRGNAEGPPREQVAGGGGSDRFLSRGED